MAAVCPVLRACGRPGDERLCVASARGLGRGDPHRARAGWNEAFYARDVEFLESILADDFIVTYDDGARGDKARELELSASFNQRVISATQEDFIVQVYGETAVVWFTLRVVGIRRGEEAEIALRYTDVWVMRDGRWQCVASQSTRLNPR